MLLNLAAILLGFVLLVGGADRFVCGAAALARNLGVSPLLIGLTIVGFGTSAPEILVSGMAAIQGNPGLAIGNAIGSNIANIGLILGITALVKPLNVHSAVLKREYPVLLFVSFVALGLMLDESLDQIDGLALLFGLVVLLLWMVRVGRQSRNEDPMDSEYDAEIPLAMSTPRATFWFAAGLITLLLGSRLLVWGAVEVAVAYGVSDLVIGLTIVALGTSFPELAASITSAIKGEHDIAIGNVIGSNLYNLLAVLSIPGIIAPGPVAPEVIVRDLPAMLGLTIAIFAMGYGPNSSGRINRLEGFLLVGVFAGYQGLLFFHATHSVVS